MGTNGVALPLYENMTPSCQGSVPINRRHGGGATKLEIRISCLHFGWHPSVRSKVTLSLSYLHLLPPKVMGTISLSLSLSPISFPVPLSHFPFFSWIYWCWPFAEIKLANPQAARAKFKPIKDNFTNQQLEKEWFCPVRGITIICSVSRTGERRWSGWKCLSANATVFQH